MIKIDETKCTQCELCVQSCTTGAIQPLDYSVTMSKCMGCSHCMSVCPTDAVTQFGETGEYISDHNISPENFENLVYARKSIRNYSNKVIEKETLDQFLTLLQYAPTGTNSQQTYVTVLTDEKKIEKFAFEMISFFKKLVKIIFNPVTYIFMLLFSGKEKTEKMFSYKRMLSGASGNDDFLTYKAPLVVIFHASPDASTPEMDCNIQASYASLHAVTLGLGTCFNGFITIGLKANKKLKKELGIPKDHKVYSSLLVGYPKLDYKKRVIREELKVNMV
ncbi:MAG: nitroreductase family protein [Spirochaetaceae bacterium]